MLREAMNSYATNFNRLSLTPTQSIVGKSVCLIIPPSPFLLDERVFIHLGVLRVASSLERQGVNVTVLDLSGVANYPDVLKIYFSNHTNDWVGITATTPQLPAAFSIARTIRLINHNMRLVLGGPHVTLSYSAQKVEQKLGTIGRGHQAVEVLENMFDVLISGDGEYAAFLAFDPTCAKMIDGDDHRSALFMSNSQYEESPWPARHLIEMESYKYTIEGFPATNLIAQLGCPFHCGFCGGRNSKSLRLIRTRSASSVVNELEFLHKTYGYTGFMFYDDELNVNKNIVELMDAVSRLQNRLGVEFRLRGFIKAELFTELQAEAMYRAGFRWLLCGFEAANPRILQNIEKRATLENNTHTVEIAKKYGFKIKALMSIGHPGESLESISDVKDWLIKMEVNDFDCTIITTYPGTPYYDLAVRSEQWSGIWTYTQAKTGDRLHAYELDYTTTPDYFKGDPNGGYKSYVFTDYISAEMLVIMRDQLESEVRTGLDIKFNPGRPAIRYEHLMGQGLPSAIYRESGYKVP